MALTLRGNGQILSDNYVIDSDGTMGMGSTSPTDRITIDATAAGASGEGLTILNGTSGDTSAGVYIKRGGTTASAIYTNPDFADNNTTIVSSGALAFRADNSERMRIHSAGYVTTPNQPGFAAVRNSTFSYTGGTGYATINNWYNSGRNAFTIGSHFNHSTGVFTAPIAGVYTFKFQVLLANVQSGDDSIHVAFYQNGNLTVFGNVRAPGVSANNYVGYGGYLPVVGTLDTYCSANDTLDIRVSSSGNIEVYSGGDWGRFSGYLIG